MVRGLYIEPGLRACTHLPVSDKQSSLTALLDALDNLDKLYASIEDAYTASLEAGNFERWEEKS